MCNAMAAMGVQGAGAASSAVGAYYGAKSQKASLELQANLADLNARMSETAAQQTLLTGQREEGKSRIATANLKGTQRASLAANGVDLGVGSANQILTSTDVLGEMDANTIQANAVRFAWGYRTQAVNQQNQALMSRASAGAISPGAAGFTSLLGSAGQVASNWYAYNKGGDMGGSSSGARPSPGDGLSQGDRRKLGVY